MTKSLSLFFFSRRRRELNSPQVSIFWKAKFAADDVKPWDLLLLQWWESWRWWRRVRANPWSNWWMCSRSSPGRWSTSTSLRVSHWEGAQAAALMMSYIATPPLKATSQCRCGKILLKYTSGWSLASGSAFSLSPQVMQVVRMVSAQKVELTFVEHHACECRWITDESPWKTSNPVIVFTKQTPEMCFSLLQRPKRKLLNHKGSVNRLFNLWNLSTFSSWLCILLLLCSSSGKKRPRRRKQKKKGRRCGK